MYSEEFYNWCKLELLVVKTSDQLKTIFEQRWNDVHGAAWTSKSGNIFVNKLGLNVYKSVGKIQKEYLERGDIGKWDLTILNAIFTQTDLNKDKIFQSKLKDAVSIRNNIAHHSSKEINNQEFENYWGRLKDILLFLGSAEDDLDKIKHASTTESATFSQNVEKSVELQKEGSRLKTENKYAKAALKYSEAIIFPNIPDNDLSELYLSRCQCHFELNTMDEALEDAKMSKNLNSASSETYIMLGRIYERVGKYDKAVKNFDKALALDVNNDRIKDLRAETRKLKGLKERNGDVAIRNLNAKNFQEFKNIKNISEIKKIMVKMNPALEHVWKGHEYREDHNYYMAVECYTKAADMKNPEGMYNLALLMINGHGTEKNFKQAFKLLTAASKFKAFDKDNNPVVGVKEAEHSIALAYYEGSITEKNVELAVIWYERAVAHHNGMSANNLGLMYMNGNGVTKNIKKAEQLLLFSLNHGDPNAMDNLVTLYILSGNINKAEKWNDKSKKLGSSTAKLREKEIAQMSVSIESDLSDIIDWERENNLLFENMTIKERIVRKAAHDNPEGNFGVFDRFEDIINSSSNISPMKIVTNGTGYKYDPEILLRHNSEYSRRIYQAVVHFVEALHIFETIRPPKPNCVAEDCRNFIRRLAECYRLEHIVATFPIKVHEKAKKYVLLTLHCSNAIIKQNKNIEELNFNQDCKICYAVLNLMASENIDFLTHCIKEYPNNKHFYEFRGCSYNFADKTELALKDFNRIEEIARDDVDNLYHKAATLKIFNQSKKATELYNKFLSMAPKDHRKVPETHYSLGVCNMMIKKNRTEALKYLELGLNAEKDQLPFFLPYESTNKNLLELITLKDVDKKKENAKMSDPFRKELLVSHRQNINSFSKLYRERSHIMEFTTKPSKVQNNPQSLIGLKLVYLNDIDTTKDHVLKGYVLELTIISTIFENRMSTNFVAEDSNGNVQRVALYNFDKPLTLGSKISIINPYLRIAADTKPMIRVDDPNSVIISPNEIKDACHCCGKDNSKNICSQCKKARYCSKECQTLDWKEYKHKLVCC